MKFVTDLLQIGNKWSLSRMLLIILFIVLILGWTTGIATIGTGMLTIFGMLLAYAFGDKFTGLQSPSIIE